jgi:recombination protein RecT
MTQQQGNAPAQVEAQIKNLKLVLANQYQKQIENYFGDPKLAMKFLSSVISAVQRTPELLNCEPTSLINSFMTMAQLQFMPSNVSGEAYVLPYKGIAQFQLGYQGLVTLFYRAGAKSISAEIVYKNDKFDYTNGIITHSPDVFADNRGEAIGAYVIVELQAGGKVSKVMKAKDIMDMGKKFSKSFNTSFTPWKEANDPELWMWKKTVLKQVAKLVPKNETIFKAVAEDNKESNVADRAEKARMESEGLKMGKLLKHNTNENDEIEAVIEASESDQELSGE